MRDHMPAKIEQGQEDVAADLKICTDFQHFVYYAPFGIMQ